MLTTHHFGHSSPLSWLTMAVDYKIWGLNPVGYHLTNLLLHSANAALFYLLAARLLRLALKKEETDAALALGAAFASLYFSIHPLRVESVAWASERRDVLAGFFFLWTLLSYVRAVTASAHAANQNHRRALFPVALYALSSLAKPTVAPLPIALLILDYFPLERMKAPLRSRQFFPLLREKIPYFLISGICSLLAIRAQALTSNFTPLAGYGIASRLAQTLYALGFYVSKTAIPTHLSPLYPLAQLGPLNPAVLENAAIAAAAAIALGCSRLSLKATIALWAYYLTFLAPVSGLLQNGPQLVALRYSYLPCLGWALLAGGIVMSDRQILGGSPSARGGLRWAFILKLALSALWLGVLIRATRSQVRVWHDDQTLWQAVSAESPGFSDAYVNLGLVSERAGNLGKAASLYRQAALISPGNFWARTFLGRVLLAQGRWQEAGRILEEALRLNPGYGEAHDLLAGVLIRQGKIGPALEHLRRAVALNPNSAQARGNLGALLASQGRFVEAIEPLKAAARLEPKNPRYPDMLRQVQRDMKGVSAP